MAVSNDDSLNHGHVQGILGNKCAGPHNLKRFILERQLLQVIFWHGHQQDVFFCSPLSTLERRRQAFM